MIIEILVVWWCPSMLTITQYFIELAVSCLSKYILRQSHTYVWNTSVCFFLILVDWLKQTVYFKGKYEINGHDINMIINFLLFSLVGERVCLFSVYMARGTVQIFKSTYDMTSNQYFSAQLTSSMSTWFINQDVHFLVESCVDDYTVTGRVFRPYNNQQKAILNITLMIYNLTLFQPYLGGSTQYFCRYTFHLWISYTHTN